MNVPQGILTDRIWIDPQPVVDEIALEAVCRQLEISTGLGRILQSRDVQGADEVTRFLNPCSDLLHDPFLMKDMDAAVQRIRRAIDGFEKILIFGDYDVDGTASTAILYNYLKRLGARAHFFIPNRMVDGYGLNEPTIRKIHSGKPDLLIAVDNGSTALDESRLLRELGIDLIVADHHRTGDRLPEAVAVVNPQQPECNYPCADLSATGVVYKLITALDSRLTEDNFWDIQGICHTRPDYFIDLVALATVSDRSPLVGENRVLVKLGLEAINSRPRPGIAGLIRECNVRSGISPSVINFKIAPKINALGRIGDPSVGIQIMLTRSFTEGRRLARHLASVNRMRQGIERHALAEAMSQVDDQQARPAFVLVGKDWHPGVVGIIASRLAHQYRRPVVALTLHHGDIAVGSARGSEGYNVLAALESCGDLLQRFGGHVNAAGLALRPENLEPFVGRFLEAIEEGRTAPCKPQEKCIAIDTWIEPEQLNCRFVEEIGRLSPFGQGNPEPVVAVRALSLDNPAVFQNRHLKFQLPCNEGHGIDAVAWDHSRWAQHLKGTYDMAFTPQLQYSADGVKTQLKVVDLRVCAD